MYHRAVSYTHLDVYKRQGEGCGDTEGNRYHCGWCLFQNAGRDQLHGCQLQQMDLCHPYYRTDARKRQRGDHGYGSVAAAWRDAGDVYKRQVFKIAQITVVI